MLSPAPETPCHFPDPCSSTWVAPCRVHTSVLHSNESSFASNRIMGCLKASERPVACGQDELVVAAP